MEGIRVSRLRGSSMQMLLCVHLVCTGTRGPQKLCQPTNFNISVVESRAGMVVREKSGCLGLNRL